MSNTYLRASLVIGALLLGGAVSGPALAGPGDLAGAVMIEGFVLPFPDLAPTRVEINWYQLCTPQGCSSVRAQVAVRISNWGTAPTGPYQVMLYQLGWLDSNTRPLGAVQSKGLAPGAAEVLGLDVAIPGPRMLVVAVDPSVPGKPAGEIVEGGNGLISEHNNFLGFYCPGPPHQFVYDPWGAMQIVPGTP